MGDEELKTGREDEVDLPPTLPGSFAGLLHPSIPISERSLEDLTVKGLLRREMVQQAGSTNSNRGGDVVERRAVVAVLSEASGRFGENRLSRREAVVGAGKEALRALRQWVAPCGDGSWTKASGCGQLSPTYR
jgi:hypothetical protein